MHRLSHFFSQGLLCHHENGCWDGTIHSACRADRFTRNTWKLRVQEKYRKHYEGLLDELVIVHLFIILGIFTTNVHKNFLVNIFKTFICLQQAFEIKQEESNQVRALLFLTLNVFLVWEIFFFFLNSVFYFCVGSIPKWQNKISIIQS